MLSTEHAKMTDIERDNSGCMSPIKTGLVGSRDGTIVNNPRISMDTTQVIPMSGREEIPTTNQKKTIVTSMPSGLWCHNSQLKQQKLGPQQLPVQGLGRHKDQLRQ
jgi:hypothetical protein